MFKINIHRECYNNFDSYTFCNKSSCSIECCIFSAMVSRLCLASVTMSSHKPYQFNDFINHEIILTFEFHVFTVMWLYASSWKFSWICWSYPTISHIWWSVSNVSLVLWKILSCMSFLQNKCKKLWFEGKLLHVYYLWKRSLARMFTFLCAEYAPKFIEIRNKKTYSVYYWVDLPRGSIIHRANVKCG